MTQSKTMEQENDHRRRQIAGFLVAALPLWAVVLSLPYRNRPPAPFAQHMTVAQVQARYREDIRRMESQGRSLMVAVALTGAAQFAIMLWPYRKRPA